VVVACQDETVKGVCDGDCTVVIFTGVPVREGDRVTDGTEEDPGENTYIRSSLAAAVTEPSALMAI
jgi:hypothetical protein